MIYLESFSIPTEEMELSYFVPNDEEREERLAKGDYKIWRTTYSSCYPFKIFRYRDVPKLQFDDITIFYGGNGSGKSTLLNVITEKLHIKRDTVYNRTEFFDSYVEMCKYSKIKSPEESKFIASDDIFNYLLDMRNLNDNIDAARTDLFNEYNKINKAAKKGESYHLKSLSDSDIKAFRRHCDAINQSQSRFVNSRLAKNVITQSNGETAFKYFVDEITENRLYLLDEPENSLSPKLQIELKRFLEDSARFFKCQFIIATHSPFLLAIKDAKIYDLDSTPPTVKEWTDLENVRTYFDFFSQYGCK